MGYIELKLSARTKGEPVERKRGGKKLFLWIDCANEHACKEFRFKEFAPIVTSCCCVLNFTLSSARKRRNIYIFLITILFIHDVLIIIRFDSVEHVTGITLASISIDVVVAKRSIVCLGFFLSTVLETPRAHPAEDEHKGSR